MRLWRLPNQVKDTRLIDPFAAPENDTTEETSITAAAPVPSDNTELVVTLKGGTGYDDPWIVIHAKDAADASRQIGSELYKLMAQTQEAAEKFRSYGPAKPAAAPRQSAPAAAASKPAYQQAPGGDARQCPHGEMQFKSGVSQKTGKTWKAFMCPSPKGTPDQCDAEFIR